jgi:hypothetical protein
MNLSMKHFVKDKGEHVVGVRDTSLTSMRADGSCDCCGKSLPESVRVLGKVVKLEGLFMVSSRFSPTCLECAALS